MIKISDIRTDGGTQSRAAINEETVADYAEAMRQPETVFPPITVYFDGKEYWLADGFHRVEAWRQVGRVEVPAEIRQGDRRGAILHSCGANAAHGLRRSSADKRRAVMVLLEDAEWSQWSDREIARRVRVSPSTVAKYRAEILGVTVQMDSEPRTYTTKHGTEARMDTSRIGGASKPDQETPPTYAEGDTQPDAFASGASGGGMAGAAPALDEESYDPVHADKMDADAAEPEDPATAKLRAEFRRLTPEAQEDDWVALRIEANESRQRISKQRSEIADLKARINVLTDGDDSGRKIGTLMRQLDQVKGRSAEHQANAARLQKQVNAQAAEIKKLRREIEQQEVPL